MVHRQYPEDEARARTLPTTSCCLSQHPFSGQAVGAWFYFAKGSGIWFNLGKAPAETRTVLCSHLRQRHLSPAFPPLHRQTITFNKHTDGYAHFGVTSKYPQATPRD